MQSVNRMLSFINQSTDESYHNQLVDVNILFENHTLSIPSYCTFLRHQVKKQRVISPQHNGGPFKKNGFWKHPHMKDCTIVCNCSSELKISSPHCFVSALFYSPLLLSVALFFTLQKADKAPFLHSLYLYLFIIFQN